MNGFLNKTIVIDLAEGQGGFCAKLLADLGAEVIKVESPEGDPERRLNPHSFFYLNTNKRSAIIDLNARSGKRIFRALIQRADVLVEAFSPGSSESIDFSPQRLRRINPRLVHVSLSPFGRKGCANVCDADVPMELPGSRPHHTASLFAAVAVLLGLQKRKITGKGNYLDLSIHEAVASMLENELAARGPNGNPSRSDEFSILRAQDGYVLIPILSNWDTLMELMASDQKADDLLDKMWQDPGFRERNLACLVTLAERWTQCRSRQEILDLGQGMGFPWASVHSMDEVIENPQLKSRHFFFHTSPFGIAPAVAFPGVPFRSDEFPNALPGPAPVLGEHTRIVLEELRNDPRKAEIFSTVKRRCSDGKILQGIRVIDLTRMISGPYATRILADFGADILKIQSEKTAKGAERNDTLSFSLWNRNKRSLNLDLSFPAARDAFVELIAKCDLVVENYSPRVMANWGLDYARLKAVNPDLIMVSISAMGQTGPWKDFVGFAPTFHALSGLIAGRSDRSNPPADIRYPYADFIAGLYAAFAALSALEYRDRTGKGQHIDLSILEAMCTFDSRFGTVVRLGSTLPDLTGDLKLMERRFFVPLHHPILGTVLSSRTPLWNWRRKPRWKASPSLPSAECFAVPRLKRW